MKVAFLMVVVGDLGGSGGAERYFADLFEHFRDHRSSDTYLVTAVSSMRRLQAAGRLRSTDRVIALPLGARPAAGRLNLVWTTLLLLWTTLRHRFDVVHICLPTPTYVPFAAVMTRLPAWMRPAVTLNVIDCTVAANLQSRQPSDVYERQVLAAHRMFSRWTRVDGIFSWYQAFIDVASATGFAATSAFLAAARFCFADAERFRPAAAKEKLVVFAGRLSAQKRPLLFVDAIAALVAKHPQLVGEWRFVMYGAGELQQRTAERIAYHGLGSRLTLTQSIDMCPVFARSRVFVSTQAFENFTSLAMLEAMASGNAIIAADVGQTREFVRDGDNGFLVQDETPEGFAAVLAKYLAQPERHDDFAAVSRALVVRVHTIDNAAADLASFWQHVSPERPSHR